MFILDKIRYRKDMVALKKIRKDIILKKTIIYSLPLQIATHGIWI